MLYKAYFLLKNFLGDLNREEGQGLVEYALILVLVSIVVIVILGSVGDQIKAVFQEIVNKLVVPAGG